MFSLDDDNPAQAALPGTYGVDDLPLILQDDVFGGGGQTLVNGSLRPVLATAQSRLRLRLLNATPATVRARLRRRGRRLWRGGWYPSCSVARGTW